MNYTRPRSAWMFRLLSASLLAGLSLAPSTSQASTDTWSGTASPTATDWNTSGNWGSGVPASGSALVFGSSGAAGYTLNDDLGANFSVAGITFNTGGSAYTINTSNSSSISLTSGITNNTSNTETFNVAVVNAIGNNGTEIFSSVGNLVFNGGFTNLNTYNSSNFSGTGAITFGSGGITANATPMTLTFTNSNAVAITGAITDAGYSQTFNFNNNTGSATNDTVTISGNTTASVGTGTSAANFTFTNNGNNTLSGNFTTTSLTGTSGVINFTFSGTGTSTLSGNNSFYGTTTLTSGTLVLGSTTALGTGSESANVTSGAGLVVNGGTLDLNGFSNSVKSLSGTGGTITNNGSAAAVLSVYGNNAGGTYTGVIQDGSSHTTGLTIGSQAFNGSVGSNPGNSYVILTGANTYTGPTTIGAGGGLQLGNAGTTGGVSTGSISGSTPITFNGVSNGSTSTLQALPGTLVFDQSSNVNFNNTVSGPGEVIFENPATVTVGGTLSNSGGYIVNSGNVVLNYNAGAAPASNILYNGVMTPITGGVSTTSGSTTVTLNSGTNGSNGIAVGDYIWSDGLASIITATSGSSGNTFTVATAPTVTNDGVGSDPASASAVIDTVGTSITGASISSGTVTLASGDTTQLVKNEPFAVEISGTTYTGTITNITSSTTFTTSLTSTTATNVPLQLNNANINSLYLGQVFASGTQNTTLTSTNSGGANLVIQGVNGGSTVQTIGTITFGSYNTSGGGSNFTNGGAPNISLVPGSSGGTVTLNIGGFTNMPAGGGGLSLNINIPTNATVTLSNPSLGLATALSNGYQAPLLSGGGQVTLNGNDFAVIDEQAGAGNKLIPLGNLQNSSVGASNYYAYAYTPVYVSSYAGDYSGPVNGNSAAYDVQTYGGVGVISGTAGNSGSLITRFNDAGEADTLDFANSFNTYSTFENILVTSAVGNNLSLLTGTPLRPNNGNRDEEIYQNNPNGILEIDNVIQSAGLQINQSGPGTVLLTSPEGSTGYAVEQGRVIVAGNSVPSMAVTGTYTANSSTLTNVSNTANLYVGEQVVDSSFGSASYWITTINGSSVGLSTAPTNSGVATSSSPITFVGGAGLGGPGTINGSPNSNAWADYGATIQIGNGGTSGNLFPNQLVYVFGTLAFDWSGTGSAANGFNTFSNQIGPNTANLGSVETDLPGSTTTIIGNSNQYTGGTNINNGTTLRIEQSPGGTLSATASDTAGSNILTVSSATGLYVGETITTTGLASSLITAINGNTVYVNNYATSTNSGAAITGSAFGTEPLGSSGTVTLNGTSVLDLGGFQSAPAASTTYDNVTVGGIALNGGTIQNGIINTKSGSTVSSGAITAMLGGTGGVTTAGVIDGAPGGLTKTGSGTVTLSGLNYYNGVTTVSGGVLSINSVANGGGGTTTSGNVVNSTTTAGSTTANDNGSFNPIVGMAIYGSSSDIPQGDVITAVTGGNNYTLATAATATITSSADYVAVGYANPLGTANNSAASLVLDGGTLQFTGSTTGNGTTAGNTTDRLFTLTANGGTLDGSGTVPFVLNGNGAGSANAIATSGSGTRTLTLTGTSTAANYLGALLADGTGGSTSLTKTGTGTWNIGGLNTYTGATTVTGGTLEENLSLGAASTMGTAGTSILTNYISSSSALVLGGGAFDLVGRGNGSGTAFTTTFATGVNQITVSSTAGLVVGQQLTGSGLPGTPFITAINGNVLTLSGYTTAAESGETVTPAATTVTTSQTLNGLTVNPGSNAIAVNSNGGTSTTLALGAITRNVGGTVDFTPPTSGSITTTTANTGTSILGGWATANGGANWAVSAGTGSVAGAITALGTYTNDTWTAGSNTTVTLASNTAYNNVTANSLRFNAAAADTVNLNGTDTITTGGILVTPSVGAFADTITGGTLKGKAGADLIVNQFDTNASGGLTIGSIIADNGSATGLTLSGGGALTLTAANTYTGATTIGAGTLNLSGSIGNSGGSNVTTNGTGVIAETSGGSINGSSATFTQNSTGTSTLYGTNTYGGVTTVNAGTLQIGNGTSGTIDNTASVTVGSAGALAFNEAGGKTFAPNIADSGTVVGAEASGTNTLSGTISGSGGVTQTGAGTTTLTGINTFTGNIAINAGTLGLGGAGQLGSGAYAGNIANSGTFVSGSSANQTLSGNISGTGALTQNGTGTLTLTGYSSYSGATTVNAGTLQVGNGTTGSFLATGPTTVGSSGTVVFEAVQGLNYTGAITNNGAIIGNEGSANTNILSGGITGTGSFTQNGVGTTILSGVNNYSGTTAVNAGTVQIGDGTNGSLAGTNVTVANQAVLAFNGANGSTYSGNVTLAATEVNTLGVPDAQVIGLEAAGNTNTLSGVISGGGGFTQNGAGTTILTGANTYVGTATSYAPYTQYSGLTAVNAGTLQIGNGTSGSISGTSQINVAWGANLIFDEANGGAQSNNIANAYNVITAQASGSSLALSGVISGTGTFTQTGSGTTTLSGPSTYTGGTLIQNGTVVIGVSSVSSTGALGTGSVILGATSGSNNASLLDNGFKPTNAITVAAGSSGNTLSIGGINTTGTSNYNEQITLDNNLTVTQVNGGTTVLSGLITTGVAGTQTLTFNNVGAVSQSGATVTNGTGTLAVTQIGTGTTTLAGANTYTGGTSIQNGTVLIGISNSGTTSGALGPVAAAVTLGASSGSISASLLTSGAFTFSNAVTVNAGGSGTLSIGGNSANTSIFSGNDTLDNNLTVSQVTGGTTDLNGNVSTGVAGTQTLTFNGAGAIAQSTGVLSNGTGTLAVTKLGTGTTTLSSANTYTGPTEIDGGILNSATLANGGTASAIGQSTNAAANLVFGGGTLQYTTGAVASTDRLFTIGDANGNTATIDSSAATADTLTFSNTGAIAFGNTSAHTLTLTGTNTGSNTFDPILGDNTGATSLSKTGAGTWILAAANTYSGSTTVSAGVLDLKNALAAQNSIVTISAGTGSTGTNNGLQFDSSISGHAFTIGGLSGASNEALLDTAGNAVALTVGNNNDTGMTYSGVLSGAGSLTKTGTGTQTLSNTANTFTGAVAVQNGTLSFAGGNSSANGAQSLGEATGASAITLGGSGTSGTLQYTGGAGTLAKNIASLGSGVGGTGDTIQNSGTGLLTLTGGLVKNGTFLTLAGGTSGINVTTTAISGSSANSDLLVTAGTTTISVASTYNGATDIYGNGVLANGIANALPTSTTVNLGSATLESTSSVNTYNLNGFSQSLAGLTSSNGSSGTDTNSIVGGTGNGATTVSNLTLTPSGTDSFGGVIGGSGSNQNNLNLIMAGTGSLVLSGASTYSGAAGTTVQSGTLVAGASSTGSITNGPFGTGTVFLGNASSTSSSNPTLLINGAYTVGNAINVANQTSGTVTIGGTNASSTTATYTGNITANKAVTLVAATGATTDFKTGTWTTNNNVFNVGTSGSTGNVQLDNAVNTTGGINVNYGTLTVNSNSSSSPVALASGTTLSNNTGTGTVGAVTLAGSDTLSSSGTALTASGITVNSTGNVIGTGTVNGAITQTSSSGLTVSGSAGSDALGSSATLAGTGTLTTVTLAGSNTLSSTGTLHTSGITVSGTGNSISSGTVTGNITFGGGTSALTVNGTASGTVAVTSGATLSGTGSTGVVTVSGGGNINLQDSAIDSLSVAGLTTGGGTASGLLLDLQTVGGSTTLDYLNDTGNLTLNSSTTINIGKLSGTTTLTNGTYTLIAVSGTTTINGTLSGDLTLTGTALGLASNQTLSLIEVGNNIDLKIAPNVSSSSYTLTTTAVSTLLHTGQSTGLTTTLTNTGTGTADSIDYSGVGASTTLGSVGGSTISGNVANGNTSASDTAQTFAGSTAGVATISSTGTLTNHTVGGTPTGTPTGTTIYVYSGHSTWAGTGATGYWGTGTSDANFGVNWGNYQTTGYQGSPGVTAGYTGQDTASFANVSGHSAVQVNLGGATPNLNSISFNASSTSFTIGGGSDTGTITLSGTTPAITVTAGTHTIGAPIILGANTSLGVAAGQRLTISGQVSGSSYGLSTPTTANGGGGTTILSNLAGNTYGGGTTIAAGKFYVTNTSNSGTGSGSVSVTGGTLAGTGKISGAVTLSSGTSLYSGGLPSGTPVVSGNTSSSTTGLTLSSSLGVNAANLTFALGTNTNGSSGTYNFASPSYNSTYMNVGGVVTFSGSDSISLVDLTNTTGSNGTLSLRQSVPYLLISDSLGNAGFSGLVTVSGTGANAVYSLDQNGYVVGVAGAGWVMADGASDTIAIQINQFGADGVTALTAGPNGIYSAPALYLNNGNLEVVPEPGTWALMVGGLALLIVIQRRRNRLG